jgi:hypothetical protein
LIEAAGFSPPLEGQALQKALQRILQLETEALKTQYRAAHKEQLSDIRNNSSLSAAEVQLCSYTTLLSCVVSLSFFLDVSITAISLTSCPAL